MNSYNTFNDILVSLFNNIMNIEAKAIITEEFSDITNNDMHVIDAIGTGEGRNMTAIAGDLSVTVGTLTIAVNNLVKKDYVHRSRSEKDRRVVLISLTEKGRKAYMHHRRFHEEMIQATLKGLSVQETEVLVRALTNLQDFFLHYPENHNKKTKS